MCRLYQRPEVLAFLQAAKERPEDDASRLVLADWLEEQGDLDRAEFIRLQCRLAPGSSWPFDNDRLAAVERVDELIACFGGGWLGSLWPMGGTWHRGLLTVDLDHRTTVDDLTDMLPWIDTVQFEVTGRQAFSRAVAVLTASACNHLCLVLRRPFREDNLLALLAAIPDSPCLRDLPVGRYLTHLGSSFLLTPSHIGVLHASGIETVLTPSRFWMHAQPATAFRYCRTPRHAPS